jgi:hypothetical protein
MHRLIIDAVEKIHLSQAKSFEKDKVYIWLDYCCTDQNSRGQASLELNINNLRDIISMCDCLYTPIVDLDHENEKSSTSWVFPGTYLRANIVNMCAYVTRGYV